MNKAAIRFTMFIIVTVLFMTAFYFFLKNSRAGTPLSDEDYIEQLTAASSRYETAGEDIAVVAGKPPSEEPIIYNESIFMRIISFLTTTFN